jgi:tetratricopeptide (TPR) repeat protein
MSSSSSLEALFPEASQRWDLERLYAELATVKQNKLTPTEKVCLRGLLCGVNPKDIAATLHRGRNGLGVELSRGLYQYVGAIANERVKNWRDVLAILEQAGYRQPALQQSLPLQPTTGLNPAQASSSRPLHHNLPARNFNTLIGRERELSQLLTMLSFDCPTPCISLEGMGGMGKTTLALAAAYQCLEKGEPVFDAIIFTTAKQQHFTDHGILPRLRSERNLRDIFRAIAQTLDRPDILLADFEQQLEQVQTSLTRQRTLLIVDNLETVEDYQEILAFLYEVSPLVKVIVTSRQQTPFHSLRLEPLPGSASLCFIQHQIHLKGVPLSSMDSLKLCQQTSGIPAAMVYAIGQLAAGYPLKQVPTRLTVSQGNYARFYFQSSMQPLQGALPHHLLLALALFPRPALAEAIGSAAASPDLSDTLEGLVHLQQQSLVSQSQGRYQMLPLTREYAIAELSAHPEFERQARERWVGWYLNFVQEHGGKDWKDWNDYAPLEEDWDNLEDAIEWCIAYDRYPEVRQFWRYVKCYTHAQGYRGDRFTYWDTRLDWTDWLIRAAEQHQDWETALEAMFDQGWTLTLLGQAKHLERAEALYVKAWEIRHHKEVRFQINLAIHIAVLKIQQQQLDQASQWLQQTQSLLDAAQEKQIDASVAERLLIHLLYYQGEICYKTGNYLQAKLLFERVLEQAQAIDWQRAIYMAKGWLADTAIQQGDLNRAQSLLEEGLHAATDHQDRCRAAFCQRSLARLEKERGNWATAQRWAEEAKQSFEYLGMLLETKETIVLLQTLSR